MKRSTDIVTVVTGDIVRSRVYTGHDRVTLQQHLKDSWKYTKKKFPYAFNSDFRFRITAGDEFQFVCRDFESALQSLTMLRIYARLADLKPLVTIRASIATGTRNIKGTADPYTQDGTAFRLAREGMDYLNSQRRQLTLVKHHRKSEAADFVNSILPLADRIYVSWTQAQCSVLLLELAGKTGEQIARHLRIKPQSVSKHIQRAAWEQYFLALEGITLALELANQPK